MNDIRNIKFDQLVSFLQENGEKPFRAKQIWTWLWKRGAGSFDEMTDLSVALRTKLQANFTFHRAEIAQEVQSSDKTTKFLLQFHDGKMVEGVLIPSKGRVTACLSTQIVALKKVDTEGVKKLYLCESIGVPPERRA